MKATNPDYDDDIVVKDENGDTLNPSSITFKNISSNLMPMTITVNGKTTYSLVAHYEAKTEDLDNSLASLKINGTNISLTGTTLSHTVGSAVNKIKVEYTLKDSEKFEIDKDLSNLSGEEVTMNEDGIAHVIIVVKPKDSTVGGTSKTYTITVKKEGTAVPGKFFPF